MEKQVLYKVEIQGNEAVLTEMAKLRKENAELQRVNSEYNKSLKDGKPISEEAAKAFERNTIQVKTNNKAIGELTKSVTNNGTVQVNMRRQLTEVRQEMQRMAVAGDQQSKQYIELRNKAAEYQEAIDSVNNEIKTFADGERVFTTVAQGAQTLATGFQTVLGVQALLGFESEKFEQTMQKLVAVMAVTNGLQTLANNLKKESAVRTAIQAGVTKTITAVQWAWNAAMAGGVKTMALLTGGLSLLAGGVALLITNWDKVIDRFGVIKEFFGITSNETANLADETDGLTSSIDSYNSTSNEQIGNLEHQIRLFRAQGASIEDIISAQRQLIQLKIQEATANERAAHSAMIWGELSKEAYAEVEKTSSATITKLINDLEVLEAEEERRNRERIQRNRERINKEVEDNENAAEATRIKKEEEALDRENRERISFARLQVLRSENFSNELALLQEQSRQKLDNDKLTDNERLVLIEEFLIAKAALEEKYDIDGSIAAAERDKLAKEDEKERLKEFNDEKLEYERNYNEALENLYHARMDLAFAVSDAIANAADDESEIGKAIFIFQRALAIFDVLRKASVANAAITANLALVPPVIGAVPNPMYPYAVAMAAKQRIANNVQSAASIAQITASSIPTIKKFESGGTGTIVKGKSHSMGGIPIVRGDTGQQIAEIEGNEYFAVVNKYDSERAALLDSINQTHGSTFGINSGYYATGGTGFVSSPRQDFRDTNVEDALRLAVEQIGSIPVYVLERDITGTQRRVQVLERSGDL